MYSVNTAVQYPQLKLTREARMDIWTATNAQIAKAAARKTGKRIIAIARMSGLWADVTLADNSIITVYARECETEAMREWQQARGILAR